MQRNNVGVPFNEITEVFSTDGIFCLKHSIEHIAFMINFSLGRIYIFRLIFFFRKNARTKGNNFPREIMYRKNYSAPKAIINSKAISLLVVLFFNNKPCFLQYLLAIAFADRCFI